MKRCFVFLVIFLFAVPVLAQQQVGTTWVSRYDGGVGGDDRANAMAVDGAGNAYVTGWITPVLGSPPDYATVKYLPDGTQLWVRTANPANGPDIAVAIALDGAGNVGVTGYSWGGGNYNYATIGYDPAGVQRFGFIINRGWTDMAQDIAADNAGNFYVTGSSSNGANMDYFTQKYPPGGGIAWTAIYNAGLLGGGDDSASAIAVDNAGNVFVVGQSKVMNAPPTRIIYLIKYDPNGNQLWAIGFGSPPGFSDYPYDMVVDGSGNVYVVGRYGNGIDYFTTKVSSGGALQWTRYYNGPGSSNDFTRAVVVDGSGNVYVTGQSTGSGTGYDYATIKYNSAGTQLWVQTYNGPANNDDFATSIALDGSGNVYVAGGSIVSGASHDYTIIKYAPDGSQVWIKTYDGTASGDDYATKVAVNNQNNVYVTGSSNGFNYDYATMMLWQSYPPVVTAVDSTKFLCFADTIRFNVVATDPDATDSLTLSGPGIPVPVKGVSPLSVEAKIYVSSSGIYDYVYSVTDGHLSDADTATYQVTINTAPIVAAPDSSKIFCGPDTIRFRVTATDPNAGDTLTLSGPGIPLPITGPSPLSANVKIYVSATGTYNYVYAVTDKCSATDDDTASWAITINTPPSAFSLMAPAESSYFVPFLASFDWQDAIDPDPGVLKYDFLVSTSRNFHPDSTLTHSNLTVSQYNDTLGIARYWWKVKVSDNCGFVWSTQTWTFMAAKRGDANADKQLTVSDVVYLINYLFKGGQKPIPEVIVGDANCDKQVTVSDVVYLINYLFKGGLPPC